MLFIPGEIIGIYIKVGICILYQLRDFRLGICLIYQGLIQDFRVGIHI